MKKYKYIGTFQNADGHEYDLEVYCNGYLQAFFLLTAKAIESGKHYKLHVIKDDEGNTEYVDSSKYESFITEIFIK